jgi:Leucine-rich repeat (LRR) protein
MGAGASAQKSKASSKSKLEPPKVEKPSAAEQPIVSAADNSTTDAANPATDAPATVEESDLAVVEFSPTLSPILDASGEIGDSNNEVALQEFEPSSSPTGASAEAPLTVMPPAPERLSTVEYTGDHRAWKTAQLQLEKPSFSARVIAAVVRRAQKLSSPPTPSFNLPEGGWGTDPAAVIAGLREKHGVPKRTHQVTKVDHDNSRKGSNGPNLDWACQGVQDLPNTELKYFRGKTSVELSHNPLSELPIGFGNLTTLKHLNLHDCDLGDNGLPRSAFSGLTYLSMLDLSCNLGITEVSKDFGSLFRLKRLVLHGCRIFRVDDAVSTTAYAFAHCHCS